ncbi:MAG TPA: DUF4385 domain-containing protein [Ktedonobacteraceae bacterium]
MREKKRKETSGTFDYSLDYGTLDFRQRPDLYRIGKGEQGVLLVEPYKSEILPHWRFRTLEIARESAEKIYQLFLAYRDQQDFVGMDMARKFLQMGYTRARRYANHASGRKYTKPRQERSEEETASIRPQEADWQTSEKALAASVFYEKYLLAKSDPTYLLLRQRHQEKHKGNEDNEQNKGKQSGS